MQEQRDELKVGIAVLGTVGKSVTRRLDAGIPNVRLTTVATAEGDINSV